MLLFILIMFKQQKPFHDSLNTMALKRKRPREWVVAAWCRLMDSACWCRQRSPSGGTHATQAIGSASH